MCLTDDNKVGFFKAAIDAARELQDAASYYNAVKPTIESKNSIVIGTDQPPCHASMLQDGAPIRVFL
jgi:hypothetical protein